MITAAHDSVVPSEQSRRLYEAARSPKQLVVIEGVDHNDYELLAGPRLKAEILQFLHSLQQPDYDFTALMHRSHSDARRR